jgi:hypothetical protein
MSTTAILGLIKPTHGINVVEGSTAGEPNEALNLDLIDAAIGALQGRQVALQFLIDGGGSAPSTGAKGQISVPFACTVKKWILTADQSGSAVIDVLRSTYAGFPTTASIAGTDKPTLASAQKNQNVGPLSLWGSTALAAGDELQVNLNSVTTCTRLNLTLIVSVP